MVRVIVLPCDGCHIGVLAGIGAAGIGISLAADAHAVLVAVGSLKDLLLALVTNLPVLVVIVLPCDACYIGVLAAGLGSGAAAGYELEVHGNGAAGLREGRSHGGHTNDNGLSGGHIHTESCRVALETILRANALHQLAVSCIPENLVHPVGSRDRSGHLAGLSSHMVKVVALSFAHSSAVVAFRQILGVALRALGDVGGELEAHLLGTGIADLQSAVCRNGDRTVSGIYPCAAHDYICVFAANSQISVSAEANELIPHGSTAGDLDGIGGAVRISHGIGIASAANGMLIEAFIAQIQNCVGGMATAKGQAHLEGDLVAGLHLVLIAELLYLSTVDLEHNSGTQRYLAAVAAVVVQFLNGGVQGAVRRSDEGVVGVHRNCVFTQIQCHGGRRFCQIQGDSEVVFHCRIDGNQFNGDLIACENSNLGFIIMRAVLNTGHIDAVEYDLDPQASAVYIVDDLLTVATSQVGEDQLQASILGGCVSVDLSAFQSIIAQNQGVLVLLRLFLTTSGADAFHIVVSSRNCFLCLSLAILADRAIITADNTGFVALGILMLYDTIRVALAHSSATDITLVILVFALGAFAQSLAADITLVILILALGALAQSLAADITLVVLVLTLGAFAQSLAADITLVVLVLTLGAFAQSSVADITLVILIVALGAFAQSSVASVALMVVITISASVLGIVIGISCVASGADTAHIVVSGRNCFFCLGLAIVADRAIIATDNTVFVAVGILMLYEAVCVALADSFTTDITLVIRGLTIGALAQSFAAGVALMVVVTIIAVMIGFRCAEYGQQRMGGAGNPGFAASVQGSNSLYACKPSGILAIGCTSNIVFGSFVKLTGAIHRGFADLGTTGQIIIIADGAATAADDSTDIALFTDDSAHIEAVGNGRSAGSGAGNARHIADTSYCANIVAVGHGNLGINTTNHTTDIFASTGNSACIVAVFNSCILYVTRNTADAGLIGFGCIYRTFVEAAADGGSRSVAHNTARLGFAVNRTGVGAIADSTGGNLANNTANIGCSASNGCCAVTIGYDTAAGNITSNTANAITRCRHATGERAICNRTAADITGNTANISCTGNRSVDQMQVLDRTLQTAKHTNSAGGGRHRQIGHGMIITIEDAFVVGITAANNRPFHTGHINVSHQLGIEGLLTAVDQCSKSYQVSSVIDFVIAICVGGNISTGMDNKLIDGITAIGIIVDDIRAIGNDLVIFSQSQLVVFLSLGLSKADLGGSSSQLLTADGGGGHGVLRSGSSCIGGSAAVDSHRGDGSGPNIIAHITDLNCQISFFDLVIGQVVQLVGLAGKGRQVQVAVFAYHQRGEQVLHVIIARVFQTQVSASDVIQGIVATALTGIDPEIPDITVIIQHQKVLSIIDGAILTLHLLKSHRGNAHQIAAHGAQIEANGI